MTEPLGVLLMDGDVDSAVMLKDVKGQATIPLFVDTFRRHSMTAEGHARWQCESAGLQMYVADLSSAMKSAANSWAVLRRGGLHCESAAPHARLVELAIAASFAADRAATHIIIPDCASDKPRETTEFYRGLGYMMQNAPGKVRLVQPYLGLTKANVVSKGHALGVDFSKTITCVSPEVASETKPCGKCKPCVERLEAFYEADLDDPLEYRDAKYWMTVSRVPAIMDYLGG